MRATRPRASSRDAILRVFAEQVADRGYADTSLGDIAAELNLSKGTIVHHFGTKEALLREVHVAYFARRFAEADYVHEQLKDPVSRLAAMIYALLAAHRDDRAASLACLRELSATSTATSPITSASSGPATWRSWAASCGTGRTRACSAPPTRRCRRCRSSACATTPDLVPPGGSQSVEDIARLFARNILDGLAGTDGPAWDAALDELITQAIDTVQRAPGRLPWDT